MPWLNPILDKWNDWVAQSVPRAWPNVNDNRRREGFWFSTQGIFGNQPDPPVAPMMGRLVTRFIYQSIEATTLWVEVDCVSIGPNQFGGFSGINALGQQLDIVVTNHHGPHPVHGVSGVAWDWNYSRSGFADDVQVNMFYPWNASSRFPRVPYDFDYPRVFQQPPVVIYTQSEIEGTDTDWTDPEPIGSCTWKAITSGREIANN